ncbi:MAG: peptidyl-prolyl cis-trans isomerase, partial [Lachnospiraceae bacterium]
NLTLSQMAQIMTMDFLAEEKGIKLGEEEKSKIKEAAQEYYLSLNEEEKQYMCVNQGDIEKLYTRYGLANKLYTSLTGAINAEVSDDDARVMEAMQIYVTEERVADEIQNQLSQGGDFVSLAGLYSEVEERTITFGRENVSKELAEVAFQLEDQQTSGKIAANNGFYFLKCTNHYNQELTDANKSVILENRRKETFEDVYSEYLTTISSKYNEKVWDEVKLKINDKITTDSFFQVYDKYCKW